MPRRDPAAGRSLASWPLEQVGERGPDAADRDRRRASSGCRSHGVRVPAGTVYAFRDLTDERALERAEERLRLDRLARAADAARGDLRRGDDAPPRATCRSTTNSEKRCWPSSRARPSALRGSSTTSSRRAGSTRTQSTSRSSVRRAARSPRDVVAAQRVHLPRGIELASRRPTACRRSPRSGQGAPGARQPRRERDQVLAGGRPRGGARSRRSGSRPLLGQRPRARHPAVEQQRIFEKFYRLDPNLTRGVGGTGLGLYISREIVRRMDGRIWVESEPGEGSTFIVELPRLAAREAREAALSAIAARAASDSACGRVDQGESIRPRRRRSCAGGRPSRRRSRPTRTRRSTRARGPGCRRPSGSRRSCRCSRPETEALTAHVRMAPTAIRKRLTPRPMTSSLFSGGCNVFVVRVGR